MVNSEGLVSIPKHVLLQLTSGGGLQGLIQQLSVAVNRPLLLTNTTGLVLASAALPFGLRELSTLTEVQKESGNNRCLLCTEEGQHQALYFTVIGNKKALGYLYIISGELFGNFEESHAMLNFGQMASLVCGLELDKQQVVLSVQRQYKEAFLFDLLYGNMDSADDIISRGKIWGWDLKQPNGVLVFLLEEYEEYSQDHNLVEALLNLVEESVYITQNPKHKPERGEEAPPILMSKKNEVILILPVKGQSRIDFKAQVLIIVEEVHSKSGQRLRNRSVQVGAGRVYPSPVDIFRSYQEAKSAVELGRLSATAPTPFFAELGLAQILYNHDQQELRAFYLETLGELEKYDFEHSHELGATLEKYLGHQFDLKATARELFLHPNTLRYRLKKIEEILEMDLDDFDTKLNLMVAIKIKYLNRLLTGTFSPT